MKRTEGIYLIVYVCVAISLLIMLHYVRIKEHYDNPLTIKKEESSIKPEKETNEVKMVVTKDKPAPKDVGTRLTKLEEDVKLLLETSDSLKDHQDKQDKKVKDAESSIAQSAATLDSVNSA